MALPVWVAAGAKAAGQGAVTPPLPAGLAIGDILVLFAESNSAEAVTIPTPNGGVWTEVTGSPQASTNSRLTVFWSRYNGSQGDPTTNDPGDHICATIAAWRGCIASGNPWDITVGGVENVSDTSVSCTGGTTTVAECLIIIASSSEYDSNTGQYSNFINGDLTAIVQPINNNTSQGGGGGFGVAEGAKAVAGTFGATTATLANASTKGFLTIALKPPSGPVEKTASDSLALAVSESIPALLTSLSRSDSLAVAVAEAVPALLGQSSRSDSLAVGVSDLSDLAVLISATDALSLSVAEASDLIIALTSADDLALGLDEAATLLILLARSDSLGLGLEEVVDLVSLLSRVDSLALSLAEAAALAVILSSSDALSLGVAEAADLIIALAAGDTLALGVGETSSLLAVLDRADDLGLAVTEVSDLLALLSRADSLALGLTEQQSSTLFSTLTDALALGITEVRSLLVALARSDLLRLRLTEIATVTGPPGPVGWRIVLAFASVASATLRFQSAARAGALFDSRLTLVADFVTEEQP